MLVSLPELLMHIKAAYVMQPLKHQIGARSIDLLAVAGFPILIEHVAYGSFATGLSQPQVPPCPLCRRKRRSIQDISQPDRQPDQRPVSAQLEQSIRHRGRLAVPAQYPTGDPVHAEREVERDLALDHAGDPAGRVLPRHRLGALRQSGPWTLGVLANHIWSVAGDDDRPDVTQPYVNYTPPTATSFFLNTKSSYDWEKERWSVPINAGVNRALVGRLRARPTRRRPAAAHPQRRRRRDEGMPRRGGRHVDLRPARRAGAGGLVARRGRPELIVSDHGTEFTSNAMLEWTQKAGIAWHFIAPGKPMQNGICESFNGRMRDELLNETLFFSLGHARAAKPAGSPTTTSTGRIRLSATRPRRPTPPNSPQWAIASARRKRSADRPLLRRHNRAQAGCQWRMLPRDFPPRSTVLWLLPGLGITGGVWAHVHDVLYRRTRELEGRDESPTAAIIDSQSVKTGAEAREIVGCRSRSTTQSPLFTEL